MNPEIGSIIPFGDYKWRVLDVQGGEALIITEEVIEKNYYNLGYENVTWKSCGLREYLNNKFLQKFTKEQQERIVEKRIPNPNNLWYSTRGGGDTRDKVFLLSLEEADKYFGDSGDYLNKRRKWCDDNGKLVAARDGRYYSNNYDMIRIALYKSEACWWWLRSPGRRSRNAAFVSHYGDVYVFGNDADGDYGVRPALWLKV